MSNVAAPRSDVDPLLVRHPGNLRGSILVGQCMGEVPLSALSHPAIMRRVHLDILI